MPRLKDIVDRVASETGLPRGDCAKAVSATLSEVRRIIGEEERVSVPLVGAFRRRAGEGTATDSYVAKLK